MIDPRSPDEIWATAVHEAGHAVIARVLGYPAGRTSIIVSSDAAGYSVIKEYSEALDYWERAFGKFHREEPVAARARTLILMAGRAAEIEILGQCVEAGANDDELWIARMTGDTGQASEQRLRIKAQGLVRRHRARIDALARALLEHRSMSDGEIRKTIGLPRTRRKHWFYWARRFAEKELRDGLRPRDEVVEPAI